MSYTHKICDNPQIRTIEIPNVDSSPIHSSLSNDIVKAASHLSSDEGKQTAKTKLSPERVTHSLVTVTPEGSPDVTVFDYKSQVEAFLRDQEQGPSKL